MFEFADLVACQGCLDGEFDALLTAPVQKNVIAETGVDYISTGAITKNIRAVDLSMLFRID